MKTSARDLRTALMALEDRLRAILPEEYKDDYEDVQPVSMGSAGLRFAEDGTVAWNEMWDTFCDLAMAGGPPHKGKLLEPATRTEVDAAPERYQRVADEICRGIHVVTELEVNPSPDPGWIRITCLDEIMAQWLLRAVTIENVSVRSSGVTLDLPAGPDFRLEKEIKNVVTVAAKTCHYWLGHTPYRKERAIARLFEEMSAESPLVEPATEPSIAGEALAERMAEAIERDTGWQRSDRRYAGWLGMECPSVRMAIWVMRGLIVSNILARREETALFVPVNPSVDPDGSTVVNAVARVHRLAGRSQGGARHI